MTTPTRRTMLRAAGIAGAAVPLGIVSPSVFATSRPRARFDPLASPPIRHAAAQVPVTVVPGQRKSLRLTWNASAICTVGVPVAQTKGYFDKRNLAVELINFGGSTDRLLEAIETGKADAGVGVALRWLKPLEQGFDVRITTAIHGGCMRVLASKENGVATLADLKGKIVGASDMGAPDKNFFSTRLAKLGIDPISDVQWKVYPADVLPLAPQKGEIQALALGDPLGWVLRDRNGLTEVATNLGGDYVHRACACCVLGVRGSLIRDDPPAGSAVTEVLLETQEFVFAHPDEAAAIFAPYAPAAKPQQLAAMLRSHTHNHHPVGADLRQELAAYADKLKVISVIKPSTTRIPCDRA
jgi:NitT/TauT family transport system substrate-binding protein